MQRVWANVHHLCTLLRLHFLLLPLTPPQFEYVRLGLLVRLFRDAVSVGAVHFTHLNARHLVAFDLHTVLAHRLLVQSLQLQRRLLLRLRVRHRQQEAVVPYSLCPRTTPTIALHHHRLEVVVLEGQVVAHQTEERLCGQIGYCRAQTVDRLEIRVDFCT